MAAATATALAAENVRKEVAGLFAEAVAATAAAAAATASAAEEKKEAEFKLAAAKAVLIEASIKEAASDRALAGVGALEISMEEALAMARAKTAEAALATATAKRAAWTASKRSAIRSSDAEHGTLAFVKWRRRQRDAIVDFLIGHFGNAWELEFGTGASPGGETRIAPPMWTKDRPTLKMLWRFLTPSSSVIKSSSTLLAIP